MSFLHPVQPPGFGLGFGVHNIRAKNGGASTLAKGSLVQLDFLQSVAAVTANSNRTLIGEEDGVFTTFTEVTEGGSIGSDPGRAGILGVLLEDIESGIEGWVRLQGPVDMLIRSIAGAATGGDSATGNASTAGPGLHVIPLADNSLPNAPTASNLGIVQNGTASTAGNQNLQKFVGITLAAKTTTTDSLTPVLFDGIYGFK